MAQEATDRQQAQAQYQRQIFDAQAAKYSDASMDNLEAYMEQLYEEDIAAKVSGLGMLAQLFRDASNFETLLRQKGLLPLLARTLREEGKKSMDLAINVVSIFFSVSNFSQFHGYVMDNQVGAMTVDLVALEVQRTAVRTREHGVSPAEIAHKVRCLLCCSFCPWHAGSSSCCDCSIHHLLAHGLDTQSCGCACCTNHA